MQSNAEQDSFRNAGIKIYPVPLMEGTEISTQSWTGETDVSSYLGEDEWADRKRSPVHRILSNEETASVRSVMTEHYLDQIKDREARESARRNIEYLRGLGLQVRGSICDGQYYVRFKSPSEKEEVLSLKEFFKAKIRRLVQHK